MLQQQLDLFLGFLQEQKKTYAINFHNTLNHYEDKQTADLQYVYMQRPQSLVI